MTSSPLVKSPNDILSDMLRTYRAGLISQLGIANPSVDPGSEVYVRFTAIANEIGVGLQNIVSAGDSLMPDTATGSDLDRICNIFGISRRPASGASGFVILTSSGTTLVALGTQLISTTGLIYQVSVGGNYSNNSQIPIVSVDTGASTDQSIGSVLTWLSAPAFSQSTALVGPVELAGGLDAEDDETLRSRLLNLLQNPPQFGNWQQVAQLCEQTLPAFIQKAFVYPACNGPATQGLALAGYADPISRSRIIPDNIMIQLGKPGTGNGDQTSGGVGGLITGNLPAFTETILTSVQDGYVDCSFQIFLPLPSGNDINSLGNGWLDDQPWPIVDPTEIGGPDLITLTPIYFCYVLEVQSNTQISMISMSNDSSVGGSLSNSPVSGTTRISWIDKQAGWIVRTATVLQSNSDNNNVVGTNYEIIYDTPFIGIAAGDYIFPSAQNAQNYVDAVLNHFSLMGPGEKSSILSVLPRAARKPLPSNSFPYCIDNTMLKDIINSGSEVLDCQFYATTSNPNQGKSPNDSDTPSSSMALSPFGQLPNLPQSYTNPSPPPNTITAISQTSPPVPGQINWCPIVFIPRSLGFYQ